MTSARFRPADLTSADPGFGLPAPVADLLRRIRDDEVRWSLGDLAHDADLDGQTEIPPDVAAEMVRPYQWLMDRIGPHGLAATANGYLKPAVVLACVTELGLDAGYGTLNRESQTPAVLDLRKSAQRLGLIRKHGRFVLTVAGRAVTGDPIALWNHLAAKVPTGDGASGDAGRIALLLTAGGISPNDLQAAHRPMLALDAESATAGPITAGEAYTLAQPTVDLLLRLGALPGWRPGAVAANAAGGVMFARAALRT